MCEKYANNLNDFLRNMRHIMYTFEVTKSCGYSVFITAYKTQKMTDLYSNLFAHFQTTDIKELYLISTDNERIDLPMNEMLIKDFIMSKIVKLMPTYQLPCPVVYKLYITF